MNRQAAIIYYNKSAKRTAKQISEFIGGELYFSPKSKDLQKLFLQNRAIIGVCSSAILIRILAPIIKDKQNEPPLIAISPDGANIIPLLGGHKGANKLARKIAKKFNTNAAITTASETQFAFALDEPPNEYVLSNKSLAKEAMAKILNGAKIKAYGNADWLKKGGYKLSDNGEVTIKISENIAQENILTYHPKTLIIGVGCERFTDAKQLINLVEKTLKDNNLSPLSIAAIATINIKADEEGINELANYFNAPLRLFSAKELAKEKVPNPSKIVLDEIGTPSVAEACAQKGGKLIVEKQKSKRATCAIGKAKLPINIKEFGQKKGILHIVGIGPGENSQRTISATRALEGASDWVGYSLYLDLVKDLYKEQNLHQFSLGEEEKRVRYALNLAGKGKEVALICSGDGQIYAMASLVFESLNAKGGGALSEGAKHIEIISHAGISAMQIASNKVGAILGHDFCAISLSDLLTDGEIILQRLEAAAKGDFVTALYNPRSKTRTHLLDRAKEIFLKFRPPFTPVIIARSLGRKGEKIKIVPLAEFETNKVDMMSIILFGATNTRLFTRPSGEKIVFTPRGYEEKRKK